MTITWIHDEMLSAEWVRPEQPALFVFDGAWIESERISLKRIVFLYECLLAMPGVEIRKGEVVTEVTAFARRHGAQRIETARSPDPRIKQQAAALGAELIEPRPLVELPAGVDLKRFSRYWRRAEKRLLAKRR